MNKNFDNIVKISKNPLSISRYHNLNTITDDEEDTYIESFEDISIPLSKNDDYVQITLTEKDRLDLLAYKYYGNALLWWVIALANDIYDPFDVPVGSILRIPDKSSLYGLGGLLM